MYQAQHPQPAYHEVDRVPASVDIAQECNVWDFHGSVRWAKCFVDVAFSDELTQLLTALARCPTGLDYSTTTGKGSRARASVKVMPQIADTLWYASSFFPSETFVIILSIACMAMFTRCGKHLYRGRLGA